MEDFYEGKIFDIIDEKDGNLCAVKIPVKCFKDNRLDILNRGFEILQILSGIEFGPEQWESTANALKKVGVVYSHKTNKLDLTCIKYNPDLRYITLKYDIETELISIT